MQNLTFKILTILFLFVITACSQSQKTIDNSDIVESNDRTQTVKTETHRYGGWYCPDNLNGFPPVDIADWKNVPVVNGRMPTQEETHNGTSLIFVDAEKYPDAKALDITMPKLAKFYNNSSRREELIIVIQAINVANDSIVGFRYLNGGNGSARLNEVRFLPDNEIEMIPKSRFISHQITINASQEEISEVLTKSEYLDALQPTFDKDNQLKRDWRESTNINYHYQHSGETTASYADILFGNFYVQNDYLKYNEKFLLLEDSEANQTELKFVSGPHIDDFDTQQSIIANWSKKVKALSEKQ